MELWDLYRDAAQNVGCCLNAVKPRRLATDATKYRQMPSG